MTVGEIIAEPLVIHGEGGPAERARACASCSTWSACRATPPSAIRTSSPAASASASASRARWRSAQAHRLRRAGVGARRLDPGADPQPAAGPAARLRPDLSVHRARPGASCSTSPTASRSCISARSSRSRDQRTLYRAARAIPTRRRCCRPFRCRARRASASGVRSRATCRARSIRRAAAASTRAARMAFDLCRGPSRACCPVRRASRSPAISSMPRPA